MGSRSAGLPTYRPIASPSTARRPRKPPVIAATSGWSPALPTPEAAGTRLPRDGLVLLLRCRLRAVNNPAGGIAPPVPLRINDMARNGKPPVSPRLATALERQQKALADFEKYYARMKRAFAWMEKARTTLARTAKLIATLKQN